MVNKLVTIGVGVILLASPLLVSAQTASTSSNASLIGFLTQLVQTLEQELQRFIAGHNNASATVQTSVRPSVPIDQNASNTPPTAYAPSKNPSPKTQTDNSLPVLTAITPVTGSVNTVVTLSGANLDKSVQIAFYDSNNKLIALIPTNLADEGISVSASHIIFPIWSNKLQSSGNYQVKVVTRNGTSNSENFVFAVPTSATPTLTNIAPPEGWPNTVVTLSGNNLSHATEIDFYRSNGQLGASIPTSAPNVSISANKISVTVSADMLNSPGPDTYDLRVVTPSGTSNSENFMLMSTPPGLGASSSAQNDNTQPTLTSIAPTSASKTVLSLHGTNLSQVTEIDFYYSNGTLAAKSSPSAPGVLATSDNIILPVNLSIDGSTFNLPGSGTYQVKIVTPSGTSNSESFTLTQ